MSYVWLCGLPCVIAALWSAAATENVKKSSEERKRKTRQPNYGGEFEEWPGYFSLPLLFLRIRHVGFQPCSALGRLLFTLRRDYGSFYSTCLRWVTARLGSAKQLVGRFAAATEVRSLSRSTFCLFCFVFWEGLLFLKYLLQLLGRYIPKPPNSREHPCVMSQKAIPFSHRPWQQQSGLLPRCSFLFQSNRTAFWWSQKLQLGNSLQEAANIELNVLNKVDHWGLLKAPALLMCIYSAKCWLHLSWRFGNVFSSKLLWGIWSSKDL